MGYLDNSTIVVDAVLTKTGRDLLASGQAINPTSYVVTDTGVDYRLWNPSHPSGSAYYGEAIENLPLTEAVVKSEGFFQDRLVTLPPNTIRLPIVYVSVDSYTFQSLEHLLVTVETRNWAGTDEHWAVFPDITILSAANVTLKNISGLGRNWVQEAQMDNARMAEFSGGGATPGVSVIELVPQANTTQQATQITFGSQRTGAYTQVNFTIEPGELERPVTQNAIG